jgi:hypothetical protein
VSIDEVPLDTSGVIEQQPDAYGPSYFSLAGKSATVTAIEGDVLHTLWVAATVPGEVFKAKKCSTQTVSGHKNTYCDYTGVTLWLSIAPKTMLDDPNHKHIGTGPRWVGAYIEVGQAVNFGIAIAPDVPGLYLPKADVEANLTNCNQLMAAVGTVVPRSDRTFVFTPTYIQISA